MEGLAHDFAGDGAEAVEEFVAAGGGEGECGEEGCDCGALCEFGLTHGVVLVRDSGKGWSRFWGSLS